MKTESGKPVWKNPSKETGQIGQWKQKAFRENNFDQSKSKDIDMAWADWGEEMRMPKQVLLGLAGQSKKFGFYWGRKEESLEGFEQYYDLTRLSGSPVVKNPPANAGDLGWIPGLGRSPGEGNGNPLQILAWKNPIDRAAGRATVHRVAELDTT